MASLTTSLMSVPVMFWLLIFFLWFLASRINMLKVMSGENYQRTQKFIRDGNINSFEAFEENSIYNNDILCWWECKVMQYFWKAT